MAWAQPDTTNDASESPSASNDSHDTKVDEATAPAKSFYDAGSGVTGDRVSDSSPASAATSHTGDDKGTSRTVEVSPGVTVSFSGGAHTSTYGSTSDAAEPAADPIAEKTDEPDQTVPAPDPVTEPDVPVIEPAPVIDTSHQGSRDSAASNAAASSNSTTTTPTSSTAAQTTHGSSTATTNVPISTSPTTAPTAPVPVIVAPVVAAPPATPKPVQADVSTVLKNAVAPIFASLINAFERGWAESPLGLMFMAAARPKVSASADATALKLAAAQIVPTAGTNEAPTAEVIVTIIDPITGAVTGRVVGSDPEGKKITIALTSRPTAGTLIYNASKATFTYTPTTTQRIIAGVTTQVDTIGMTVTVSDGVNKTPVQVQIPISAIPVGVRADISAGGAGTIAATNTRVYVTNRAAGTVTVIDSVTATVLGTFTAGSAPDGIAVKPDGTRIYVSSSTNNTVTVLDAAGVVKATIAVAAPTALTISPSGGALYVANYDNGTLTRISTATNKVAATIKLPSGARPTGVAVSSDATRVYVTSETATGSTTVLMVSTSWSTSVTPIAEVSGTATGLVISKDNAKVYVSSDDGIVSVIDARTRAVVKRFEVGGTPTDVAISRDGSALVVTDASGRVTTFDASNGTLLAAVPGRSDDASTQQPSAVLSADGTELYVTDGDAGAVRVISLTPPNARPTVGTPTTATPSPTTGKVTGSIVASDADGDKLTYKVTGGPTKGTLVINANGTFTYTPTAAARHAAANLNAPDGADVDSFTVTVSDGRRDGVVTALVSVDISLSNKVPSVIKQVGSPQAGSGIVSGSVRGVDGDRDFVTYGPVTAPTKGTVIVTATGSFTYTPTAEARHAAMKPGATAADKQDVFTVNVDDGHGGVVTIAINVTVSPANANPTNAGGTVTNTDPKTGVVNGSLGATDLDGDTLTYTAKPSKGAFVVRADGTFTYTPTEAARDAASVANASAAAKTDEVSITVTDGYGGSTTFTLNLSVEPYPAGNRPPTSVGGTTTGSSTGVGTVTGTVNGHDPEGDPLTYTLTGKPTKGIVTLNPVTGVFTYTPTVEARYTALVTPGVDADAFTVTVSDGVGGVTVNTVSVTIVPPAAGAIDQRGTGVMINISDLLFYSQADITKAFGVLKSMGIDSVRVMMPWAAIEALPGRYDWAAMDRVVNTAAANKVKLLGVFNSTPLWAAVPNTLPLAGRPSSVAAYAKFVGLVATRYTGKVSSYEVWNEPNGVLFWQPAPDAAQYTELLKAAYVSIKKADPNAVVVAAAVGAGIDFPGFSVNPVRFISEMYAAGAAGFFDALSYHPYLYNNPFSKGAQYAESPLNQVKRIYNLMVANGDGNKKIWATEYGQPASAVSAANQASYLGDFLRTWRSLSYAGPTAIHTLLDYKTGDKTEASFGLLDVNWLPKPAMSTVMEVILENRAIEAAAAARVTKL